MKLSVIVPVSNERPSLPATFSRLHDALDQDRAKLGLDALELIVVNDGSEDGSEAWLHAYRERFPNLNFAGLGARSELRLLDFQKTKGKGQAVREAIAASSGEIVIIHEAEPEYDPRDIGPVLQPLVEGRAEAVLGSRVLGSTRQATSFQPSRTDRLLSRLIQLTLNAPFTDLSSGTKALRGDLARSLCLTSDRSSVDLELCVRLARTQTQVCEVGIHYDAQKSERGKKSRRLDHWARVFHLLRLSLLGGSDLKPGMRQTLVALQDGAEVFYRAPLNEAIRRHARELGTIRRVLEIGSGIGSITQTLVRFDEVVATDIDSESVATLRRRFATRAGFQSETWDASLPVADPKTPAVVKQGEFDLLVAFNVLEHIEDHSGALRNWSELLRPGGALIVLVPFSQRLYSPIDRAVGHYRRYSKAELEHVLTQQGATPLETRFLNPIGILGWILNGLILRRSELPAGQVNLYRWLKPFLRPLEKLLERHIGLSLVSVAQWGTPASPRISAELKAPLERGVTPR